MSFLLYGDEKWNEFCKFVFVYRLFKLLLDFMNDVFAGIRHAAVELVCSVCLSSVSMSLLYIPECLVTVLYIVGAGCLSLSLIVKTRQVFSHWLDGNLFL